MLPILKLTYNIVNNASGVFVEWWYWGRGRECFAVMMNQSHNTQSVIV